MKTNRGKLVTIEGISGVGKTYYFNKLKYVLEKEKYIFNDEINDKISDDVNSKIMSILTEKNSRFFDNGNPKLETLLICAKQVNDEEKRIIPAINKGKVVISDRGFDSLCVLEGLIFSHKYHLNVETTIDMMYNTLCKFCLKPDITILLESDFYLSISRAERRDGKKYINKELKLLKESKMWFEKKILNNKKRKVYVIDVDNLSENEVINRMISIIKEAKK